jgi:transposase
VEIDATRMCQLLVGLPAVTVRGVADPSPSVPLVVEIETELEEPIGCAGCGGRATVKDRDPVVLVDLPAFGRPTRLRWVKRRWRCPDPGCTVGTWTEVAPRIGSSRLVMTARAGRWATWQVGKHGRTVAEVAADLGCDWHTVNDAVIAYGSVLVDDPDRIGDVTALGLDETLFAKTGKWRTKQWSTSIVDVAAGRLLDVVEGRDALPAVRWLANRDPAWRAQVRFATLDMSGPYRKVFDTMLPDAVQVADPFHLVRLAGEKLDEVRRRVQNETLGHRGRKHDPLYRARRLLVLAHERLDERATGKLAGLLRAGDPRGEVTTAWHAKEAVRELYAHRDQQLALEWVDQLSEDLRDRDCPPEVRQLGRTMRRWRTQIAAWHQAQVTNGPTETMNGLAKRIKRIAFGMTNFVHWRIRVLLYAGRPNWSRLSLVALP